ncbi:MAG: aspartate aminotransferase family protein [Alphaproteobacteria bacterium]|nr:aspartate aminotransferase family protein [Alphaproteobacteria bacterium]
MTQPGNSAASRDIAHVMHPYTNLAQHKTAGPQIMSRGEGIWVYDDEGKAYIEGMAGLWCTSLGFNEPRLVEAATRQLKALPFYHTFAAKSHDPVIDLAEKLIDLAPVPMSKVFFANSGSEANDTAVKLVWYYNNAVGRPKKKKIISRIKGYHGVTVAAASLTGLPMNHRDFDLPIDRILHTDCPHYYRFAEEGESEEDFATRLANNLETLIEKEGPETIAAFIAEPVMGAGGVIVPPATYFEKIQPILKKHDILFIVDEVICGFGRTGNMFATETFKLEPDIITVAKALSSAYLPISGLLINEKVTDPIYRNSGEIGTFGHGFTYSAHPVCAAVALETLKIYVERDILGHVRRVMPRFIEAVQAFADHPLVGEVRGVGLVAGVELVKDKATKESFDAAQGVGAHMAAQALEHGLVVRAVPGDTVTLCPPLIINEDEIDMLFDRLGQALSDTADWVAKSA